MREEQIKLEELNLNTEQQQQGEQQHQFNKINRMISLAKKTNDLNFSKNQMQPQKDLMLTKHNLHHRAVVNQSNDKNKTNVDQTDNNKVHSNRREMLNDGGVRVQVKNYLRNTQQTLAKVGQSSKPLPMTEVSNSNNHISVLASKGRYALHNTLNGVSSTSLRQRTANTGENKVASKLNATFPSMKTTSAIGK